jgi:predicted DNA-binding transcriptional regulator YafY
MWIDNVEFNTISNTSTGCGNSTGYENYTYMSTQVQQGNTYTMKLTNNPNYRMRYYVWVDLDDNGVFDNNSTERWLNNRLISYGSDLYVQQSDHIKHEFRLTPHARAWRL